MDGDRILALLLEAASLKRMPRAGWITHGVPQGESVAEHSFGVIFVALTLVDAMGASSDQDGDLDLEKVLVMALLHDLAEVRLTDLPSSATRLIPEPVKSQAEKAAMESLLAPLPGAEQLRALWQQFEDNTSAEGRLVRDADKLEMMIQCLRYELAGSRGLDEFWAGMDNRRWNYALSADLYDRLKSLRPRA
jgi:putative hydrolase of HD superfamily